MEAACLNNGLPISCLFSFLLLGLATAMCFDTLCLQRWLYLMPPYSLSTLFPVHFLQRGTAVLRWLSGAVLGAFIEKE